MRRYELSIDQYEAIEDLLPMNGKVGGQWKDHRSLLNGMFWVLYSGAQLREMPDIWLLEDSLFPLQSMVPRRDNRKNARTITFET